MYAWCRGTGRLSDARNWLAAGNDVELLVVWDSASIAVLNTGNERFWLRLDRVR
jgi:hypothetical protein